LNPQEISILASAALATSMLSAELVSNGSRTFIQRAHVRWSIIGSHAVLLLPMSVVGLHIARALSPPVARLLIGVFVLVATWAPALLLLGTHPERTEPRRRFLLLGGVVGIVNMTVGAAGPLIAPFFLNLGLSRQAIIGTKAASQALGLIWEGLGLFAPIRD
jgi:uncharacterized membrane protein YfcA